MTAIVASRNPLRSRFLWKLYAGLVVLVLLTASTIGMLVTRQFTDDALDAARRDLESKAILVADVLDAHHDDWSDPRLLKRVTEIGAKLRTRLTVMRRDGTVVADSEGDPATMDNHGDRPEVIAALENGVGRGTRRSETLGSDLLYVAVAVKKDGGVEGVVRTAVELGALESRLAELRTIIAASTVLAVAVALAIGFLVVRRITAPLIRMTAAAESLSSGDYGRRVPSSSKDEVGQLADSFNRMASQLENRVRTITNDRNKLAAILGGMVEGIVAVDREKRVIHMNAVAGGFLGVSPSLAVGKPGADIIRIDEISSILRQTIDDAREVKGELVLARHPRRSLILETLASPLRDGEGNLIGAVVVLHDVTELRHLEAVRRDFVANVSHELKTPITTIRGISETMFEDAEMPTKTRHRFVQKLQNQAIRLSDLVGDLLTLARLESGDGVLSSSLIDLREPVRYSVNAILGVVDEHGVRVETDIQKRPVMVLGDEQSLRQMISNLLDNAVKYTPKGGQVWLRLHANGNDAVIEVQDTGVGIDSVHHDRLFERFYRVDRARSRELGGTGLGLSIVKHVCLAHGGEVSVESEPGQGSTFRVRLPLATA